MKNMRGNRCVLACLLSVFALLMPGTSPAQTSFDRLVVFGDSLSDSGNFYALTGLANTPPYDHLDQLLIPDRPYAKGGHHFSNDATWVEQLARPLGLGDNTRPALQGSGTEATNYAVGGARASLNRPGVDLGPQVHAFLNDFGGTAPAGALYVIEFGGNDIRDALEAGTDAGLVLTAALTNISTNIGMLYGAGARKFLVLNAPDLALTPAILTLDKYMPGAGQFAQYLSGAYNAELESLLTAMEQLPGIEIVRVDFFQLLHEVVASPTSFGLNVVDSACVMPQTPPFTCQQPEQYLFWDGIHPTGVVHAIIAETAAAALAQ